MLVAAVFFDRRRFPILVLPNVHRNSDHATAQRVFFFYPRHLEKRKGVIPLTGKTLVGRMNTLFSPSHSKYTLPYQYTTQKKNVETAPSWFRSDCSHYRRSQLHIRFFPQHFSSDYHMNFILMFVEEFCRKVIFLQAAPIKKRSTFREVPVVNPTGTASSSRITTPNFMLWPVERETKMDIKGDRGRKVGTEPKNLRRSSRVESRESRPAEK